MLFPERPGVARSGPLRVVRRCLLIRAAVTGFRRIAQRHHSGVAGAPTGERGRFATRAMAGSVPLTPAGSPFAIDGDGECSAHLGHSLAAEPTEPLDEDGQRHALDGIEVDG